MASAILVFKDVIWERRFPRKWLENDICKLATLISKHMYILYEKYYRWKKWIYYFHHYHNILGFVYFTDVLLLQVH